MAAAQRGRSAGTRGAGTTLTPRQTSRGEGRTRGAGRTRSTDAPAGSGTRLLGGSCCRLGASSTVGAVSWGVQCPGGSSCAPHHGTTRRGRQPRDSCTRRVATRGIKAPDLHRWEREQRGTQRFVPTGGCPRASGSGRSAGSHPCSPPPSHGEAFRGCTALTLRNGPGAGSFLSLGRHRKSRRYALKQKK